LRAAQEEQKEQVAQQQQQAAAAASSTFADDEEYDDRIDYESVVASLSAKERARFVSTPAYQQYLAREARLKTIPSTYSTQQHASHGASFKFTSPFAPHQPHLPPAPARTSLPANAVPTAYDVTGAPRRPSNRVALPAALGPSAPAQLNQKHLLAELQAGQPRSAPKTSSTVRQTWHSSTAPFASFVLQPASVELGPVRKGHTYRVVVTLTNVGSVTGRFQVVQPRPASERDDLVHMKVLYRPGLVAPGLQRRLEVELYAGSTGQIDEAIEVRSEQHVFTLPVHATVLSDADFHAHQANSSSAAGSTASVASVLAPHLAATYERDFPASPKRHGPAGPFTLTSTFGSAAIGAAAGGGSGLKASPAAAAVTSSSKRSALVDPSLLSTVPRGNFGQTGEVRVIAATATPHVAQALQKQQAARAAARKQQANDLSEI
jgi:CRISPR-associated protein Cas5t